MRAGMNFAQGAALPAKPKPSGFLAGTVQLPQHSLVLPQAPSPPAVHLSPAPIQHPLPPLQ